MPKRDSAVFDVVAVKPYVGTWEEFAAGAKKIYLRSPAKARFTQKYRHCDGALVLKMTDDVLCLKYRTERLADLEAVAELNAWCLQHMAGASS